MLFFKCISTGSKGNCYLLTKVNVELETSETLIIELGIHSKDIFKNLNNIQNVVGAIYTHNHGDHNMNIGKGKKNSQLLQEYGIKVYGVDNLKIGQGVKMGSFLVSALPAIHDVECFTYLIEVDGKKIMFATDTNKLVKVKGCKIDTFIVEVNHSIELMNKMLEEKEERTELDMQAERSSERHLSIETLCDYFENLNYKAEQILTIHGSSKRWFDSKQTREKLKKYVREEFLVNVIKDGEICVL